MIRRDATSADGSPAWVLISQVDHAHLAGELAENWCELPTLHRKVILPTILRHDDGWRNWEQAPTIDPATGRPRSFLEMPNTVAHDIWRKSIAGVAELGPLAQYMVAEHFCRLRRAGGETYDRDVREFLITTSELCRQWLAQWQAESPTRHTPLAATQAVDYLQFFDIFSLWLCMADRTEPHAFNLPGGGSLALTTALPASQEQHLQISPWPWQRASRRFAVGGRMLPAQPLASDEELREVVAAAPIVELQWRFAPH